MLFSSEQVELVSPSIVVSSNSVGWTDCSSIAVVDIESIASATLAAVLMYGCVYRNITMEIHWKNRLGYCREIITMHSKFFGLTLFLGKGTAISTITNRLVSSTEYHHLYWYLKGYTTALESLWSQTILCERCYSHVRWSMHSMSPRYDKQRGWSWPQWPEHKESAWARQTFPELYGVPWNRTHGQQHTTATWTKYMSLDNLVKKWDDLLLCTCSWIALLDNGV